MSFELQTSYGRTKKSSRPLFRDNFLRLQIHVRTKHAIGGKINYEFGTYVIGPFNYEFAL